MLGGNSHRAHFFCSVYGRKSLKLIRLGHNRGILQGQSPATATPIQTPTETMYSNTTAVAAPVGTGGPVLAAPARVGCQGSGARSTTCKPRGPDGWPIPNLDRSTVFYRPNQTSTPCPPVGSKQPAVSAPDAGGVELQPRPVGTASGGEGQAGTGLVSSHRSRK